MNRFIPVQKDRMLVAGHRLTEALEIFNQALRTDGVTRPDITQADMFAGPTVGGLTIMLSGLGVGSDSAAAVLSGLQNFDLTPLLSSSATQEIWQHLRWARGGRVVYDLAEPLAQAFLQTDLSVTGDDVTFPVPSFYIAVPPSLGLSIWNEDGGEQVLDGFYVNEVEHELCPPDQQTDLRGTLCKASNGAKFTVPPGRERSLAAFAQAHPRKGRSIEDASHVHFSIPLKPVPRPGGGPPIVDLEEWLTDYDQAEQQRIAGPLSNIGPNSARLLVWHRIILNTCLYLTGDGADVESRRFIPDAARAHAKTLGSHAKKRYIDQHSRKDVRYSVLGSKLRVDPNITRVTTGEQRTIQSRFIVRGHWRNQAHGEGRALRKRLWIQPHWKGPAWADIVARVQTVKPEDPVTP